jgi:hypothetical protein
VKIRADSWLIKKIFDFYEASFTGKFDPPAASAARGSATARDGKRFGPAESLTYALRVSDDAERIYAQMTNNGIEIFLPVAEAERWADSDEVGLYAAQPIGDLGELKIAVEKDFVCIDRPADKDNRDAFPNPKMKC